jgi:hypothetical protein
METGLVRAIVKVEFYQKLSECLAFDLDTVKMLMSIFDSDRSGTIGFNEFSGLWRYIKDWQG